MNREAFGKVVASLRRDRFSFQTGRVWSQQELADQVGLTQRIVSKIERGQQVRLDGEILRGLADAFNLSTMERGEFFAMASEVNGYETVRRDQCLGVADGVCCGEVFGQVWMMLETVQAPAMVIDSFGDIVGMNRNMVAFYNINMDILQAKKSADGRINTLELMVMGNVELIRRVLGDDWRSVALGFLHQWRYMTMRHRHTTRYENIFAELSSLPEFRALWALANDSIGPLHDCSLLRNYNFRHGVWGPVSYTTMTNSTLCAYGRLHHSVLVPRDPSTSALFQKLAVQHKGVIPFMPWPNVVFTEGEGG